MRTGERAMWIGAVSPPSGTVAPTRGGESGRGGVADGLFDDLREYDFRFLVEHLLASVRLDDVARLLSIETSAGENAWYLAREARGEVEEYLAQLRQAVAASAFAVAVASCCRYELMASSVMTANTGMPEDFLIVLVRERLWPASQLIALASEDPDERHRGEVLAALARALDEAEAEQALTVAEAIRDPNAQRRAIVGLVPALALGARRRACERLLDSAAADTRGHGPQNAVEVISAIAPYLPDELVPDAMELCVQSRDGHTLATLAEWVPPSLVPDAVTAARLLGPLGAQALGVLAGRPEVEEAGVLRAEAAAAARTLDDVRLSADALARIARHAACPGRRELLGEALACVMKSRFPYDVVVHASSWSEGLPPVEAAPLLEAALEAALSMPEDEEEDDFRPYTRADGLEVLAPRLPPLLLERALEAGWLLAKPYDRLRATGAVVPHLLPDRRAAEAARVAELARSEWQMWWGADYLLRLAPHLETPIEETLEEVRPRLGRWNSAFLSLREHLSTQGWRRLLLGALRDMRAIEDWEEQALLLAHLSPWLNGDGPHLGEIAAERLLRIERADNRVLALAALASLLPRNRRDALVAEAPSWITEVPVEWPDAVARALQALVPMLVAHGDLAAAWRALDGVRERDGIDAVRVRLMTSLVAQADARRLAELAVRARGLKPGLVRVCALAVLACLSRKPGSLFEEALDVVSDLPRSAEFTASERSEALVFLAPRLPEHLLPRALRLARRLTDGHHRSLALAALAQRLEPVDRGRLLGEALADARASSLTERRGEFLAALLPFLPPSGHTEIALEALGLLAGSVYLGRLGPTCELAAYLPEENWLPVIRTMLDDQGALSTMLAAARILPTGEQLPLAVALLERAARLDDREVLGATAALLATHQPPESARDAALAVLGLAGRRRSKVLVDLSQLLPALLAGSPADAGPLARAVLDVCRWWP
jgi:hypothetical protein